MPLTKPPGIESDAFKSAKWDELTAGRDFAPSDAPTLALLRQWHKVAQQASVSPIRAIVIRATLHPQSLNPQLRNPLLR